MKEMRRSRYTAVYDIGKVSRNMNKVFCRIFQAGMKLGMYFLPWTTPEIIEGENSSHALAEDITKRGIGRVLVVTGPNMMKRGLPIPMLDGLKAAGIEYSVFDSLTPDPDDAQVEAGVNAYKKLDSQAIILFGGGSPMDCGKAIAARIARPEKSISQLQGILKVRNRKKMPIIWAVPTTSGTGSEATMAAVITAHETHRKKSINDVSIIPHVCVLDAALTVGLPPQITADTGMDALSHAVEAYTNRTYNTHAENEMAKKAVKLIYENLYSAYENGENIEARQNMQRAAFYAGRAFTRGCVGYVHAIGHGIGGLYGIPHGRAMAILLPHIMKAYGEAARKRLAELADVCGIASAEAFIKWMEDINEKMGIPKGFKCIKEEDIPTIAKWADSEANPLYPVPKIFNRKELEQLIRLSILS